MPQETLEFYDVFLRKSWSDQWQIEPALECLEVNITALPSIDSASFRWRAGSIKELGETSYAEVPRKDINGWYVQVVSSALPDVLWIGYITQDQTLRRGERLDNDIDWFLSGEDQAINAFGLEWFLGRVSVDSSVFNTSTGDANRVGRAVGYNTGLGDGRSIEYEDRANRDTGNIDGVPVFARNADTAELWNGREILENLLAFHGPRDKDDNPAPVAYKLYALSYLDWMAPTVRTEGRTVLQVINEVASRTRGMVVHKYYDVDDDTLQLVVGSSFKNDVVLPGGGLVPENNNKRNYEFDDVLRIDNAVVGKDSVRKYDRIKVRGARRTTTMTVSIADGNLEKSWLDSWAGFYGLAAGPEESAEKNDRERLKEEYKRVYTTFRVPETWDGMTGDGRGGEKEYASPNISIDTGSILGGEPYSIHGLRLLRTTPLLEGYDYEDATDVQPLIPAATRPEFLSPFGLLKHDTKYVFLDRSSGHVDEDTTDSKKLKGSYTLRMLAGTPGFELRSNAGLPHMIALNHFDTEVASPSNTTPEIDYEDCIFTVCAEWDTHCEGVWPAAKPNASPIQELVIYVGDRYRFDYLAENTAIDITNTGDLKLCTKGGAIQDDRGKLRDIARIAYEWYSTPRETLSIDYQIAPYYAFPQVGQLIETIGRPGEDYQREVNCVVTQVTYRLHEGRANLQAGFAELDFGGFA